MHQLSLSSVASSLIGAAVLCPIGGIAVAADAAPTMFQRAIYSWMGVVALLAEESQDQRDGDRTQDGEGRRDNDRGDRGGRAERGARDWSRSSEHGHGPRGMGRMPRMGVPPMGPPIRGMPMPGMWPDAQSRLDEIVARLSRIEQKLEAAPRVGNPWSPRPEWGSGSGRGPRPEMSEEARREMEKRREDWRKAMEARRSQAGQSAGERPRASQAALPHEMQDRVREMMQEGRRRMAEAQEKMEQARKKFQEMEERIKRLEAEVERLKSTK